MSKARKPRTFRRATVDHKCEADGANGGFSPDWIAVIILTVMATAFVTYDEGVSAGLTCGFAVLGLAHEFMARKNGEG